MSTVSWNDVSGSSEKAGKIVNFKLDEGTHTVRFVGNLIKFYKYFVNGRSAITDVPETCVVKTTRDINPTPRYAVNIIDRKDGQLKLLECSEAALKQISEWSKITKKNPGARESVDFTIKATGTGKNRRYQAFPMDNNSLSEKELEMLQKVGGSETGYDLEKIFKPVPQNEIMDRLFGNNQASNQNQAKTATQPSVTVQASNNSVDIPF